MSDVYGGPFGDYTDSTEVVSAAAKTEIQANVDKLKALFPVFDADNTEPSPSPDFDQIPPHTREKLRAEIDGLMASISAAPEA